MRAPLALIPVLVFAACGPEEAPADPGAPRGGSPEAPGGPEAPGPDSPAPIEPPAAGGPGSPCAGPDQCSTGFCIPGPGGTRCATPCSDVPCPDGTVCTATTRTPPDVTMICLPAVLDCPGCGPDGPGSVEGNDPNPVPIPDTTPDPPEGPVDLPDEPVTPLPGGHPSIPCLQSGGTCLDSCQDNADCPLGSTCDAMGNGLRTCRPVDPDIPMPPTTDTDLCGEGRIFFQDACVAGPRDGCRLGVHDGSLYAACDASEPVCWDDSMEECEAWGGHLAVINTEAESGFVQQIAGGHRAWIGLEERPEADGMGWILPSDYPPEWCEGEVDAHHGPDEWCVAINGGEDGCWKAYDCVLKWHGDSAPAFVCERPGQGPDGAAP